MGPCPAAPGSVVWGPSHLVCASFSVLFLRGPGLWLGSRLAPLHTALARGLPRPLWPRPGAPADLGAAQFHPGSPTRHAPRSLQLAHPERTGRPLRFAVAVPVPATACNSRPCFWRHPHESSSRPSSSSPAATRPPPAPATNTAQTVL